MASFKIQAGDYKGDGSLLFGILTMKPKENMLGAETFSISEVESVDTATEESVKKLGGTVGWGVAGGALLGPVGLLAGLLLGGKKKEVTFVVKFKNGKKILATAGNDVYIKFQAASFK